MKLSNDDWTAVKAEAVLAGSHALALNVTSDMLTDLRHLTEANAKLVNALQLMRSWASELPGQYLDSDPDTRRAFREDMEFARSTIATFGI